MILVVSAAHDGHATAVLKVLAEQGAPATLLDLSHFPQELALTVAFPTGAPASLALAGSPLGTLDLAQCGALWWRRPQPFGLHAALARPSHRAFAYNEIAETWAGLWHLLDPYWVNHPVRTETASRKLYQLRVAQQVGLTIPATLVSNDPEQVRHFVESCGVAETIYKTFSATQEEWRETRLLRRDEVELLDNVRYAPSIFQEYIPAVYDLRITVVGDTIFPAAIYSQETAYPYDFRMDIANARIKAVDLPAEVNERLLALMAQLGLAYGAIDMRLTPAGQYVFLELNAAGQWLFVENASGQPITACLATLLATEDQRRGAH